MKQNQLIENMIDQIKEAQIKLGYARESVRLYYPVESLNRLMGTTARDGEEMKTFLESDPAFWDTVLGKLHLSVHEGRIEIRIPPSGAEYVHKEIPDPKFLMEIVELFGTHHHLTIEEICGVFARFSESYVCEKMPEGADFDYVLYFPDGRVDGYYYCIKEEMDHTIYHRFTEADFKAL